MNRLPAFCGGTALLMFAWSVSALAQHGRPIDVGASARGAERVVVGQVLRTDAAQLTNAYGDVLIVSHTLVRVDETLKGTSAATLVVDIEGGTLNGVTMRASDIPLLQTGDHAVFFVDARSGGAFVPHQRGHGLLKLDAQGMTEHGTLSVDSIRTTVRAVAR